MAEMTRVFLSRGGSGAEASVNNAETRKSVIVLNFHNEKRELLKFELLNELGAAYHFGDSAKHKMKFLLRQPLCLADSGR